MNFKPDQKLLQKCLRHIEGLSDVTELHIRDTQLLDDVPTKINNTSKVLRIRIEYEAQQGETKKAALVVKVPFLRTESVYEFFKERRFFTKEARFYKSIAPHLCKMLRSPIAPTLYASDEHQVLYLDDLSTRGYRILTDGQLDAEHSRVVLRHLGRMHAASNQLRRKQPQLFDELVEQQFLIGADFIDNLYVEVKPLLKALAQVRCLTVEMVDRFDAAVQKAKSNIAGDLNSSRFDFRVLNHGDLKSHNIFFQHDQQGQPVQCSLIDFQMYCWASPALDLIFYTIQSIEYEVFRTDFDSLLKTYLSTLNDTLEELNSDVRLTETQLRANWDELKAFKIFTFLFRTVLNIREFCKMFEYSKYEEPSPEMLKKLSQSAEIRDRVQFWLEEFKRTGVF